MTKKSKILLVVCCILFILMVVGIIAYNVSVKNGFVKHYIKDDNIYNGDVIEEYPDLNLECIDCE